jgi:PIN domain nuclease of toxin-antitoxin system
MKLLLDTCAFLWLITDAKELSRDARELFREPANEVYLSSVAAWEIAVKYALGRLPLPAPPERVIPVQRQQHGITGLPLDEESVLQAHRLPPLHRDPFDRMLICQAIVHGMAILTPDPLIAQYAVRVVW